jgi:hypothetical protein
LIYISSHTQCAIPAFDGLLPEPHNQAVMNLLFVMAHFHGLAKLRMHHDKTLDIMDTVAISLGEELRAFNQKTCPAFNTKELRREYHARMHRTDNTPTGKNGRQAKTLNLNTYKFHSLGDYVTTIRTFGTMESYSTETVRDIFKCFRILRSMVTLL